MSDVKYKAGSAIVVSDKDLLALLDKISDSLGVTVEITSGDRNSVPGGGSRTSDHLAGRAVDIHFVGMPDARAFGMLRQNRKAIFGEGTMGFQVIHHGPHTQTQGEHIHIGDNADRNKAGFWTEGLGAASRGHYLRVEMP